MDFSIFQRFAKLILRGMVRNALSNSASGFYLHQVTGFYLLFLSLVNSAGCSAAFIHEDVFRYFRYFNAFEEAKLCFMFTSFLNSKE